MKTIYFLICGLFVGLLMAQINTYQMKQRITTLENDVKVCKQNNSLQEKFKHDQMYFNTYIYQTLIVNRGKAL